MKFLNKYLTVKFEKIYSQSFHLKALTNFIFLIDSRPRFLCENLISEVIEWQITISGLTLYKNTNEIDNTYHEQKLLRKM